MYLHIYGRSKWSLKRTARRLNRLYKRRRTCNFSSSRGTLVWKALAGREREGALRSPYRRPGVSWISCFVGTRRAPKPMYTVARSSYWMAAHAIRYRVYINGERRLWFPSDTFVETHDVSACTTCVYGGGMWFTTLTQLSSSNTSLGEGGGGGGET